MLAAKENIPRFDRKQNLSGHDARINAERKAKLEDRIRDIEKQIQDAETEKAELLVKYTPEYLKVKASRSTDQQLERKSGKHRKGSFAHNRNRSEKTRKRSSQRRVVDLKSQLDAAHQTRSTGRGTYYATKIASANLQGQAETRLTTLKSEIETNRTSARQLYSADRNNRELAISSSRPDNVKISAEAQTPSAPIGPNAKPQYYHRFSDFAGRRNRSGISARLSR